MTFREVSYGSPEYLAAVELRRRVLRVPLGLDFSSEELASEANQRHFVLEEDGDVLATLTYVAYEGGFKMRQVAVSPDRQGRGLGKRLVLDSESAVQPEEITLHARVTAVPFYERLGYEVLGEPFEEVGIPHHKMGKRFKR
jgi:predicted GNAT family N-acyltransferase